MRKSFFITGAVLIIASVVLPALLVATVFGLIYFLEGAWGIVSGAILGTIGGALCIAFCIIILMVGIFLLILGLALPEAKKKRS